MLGEEGERDDLHGLSYDHLRCSIHRLNLMENGGTWWRRKAQTVPRVSGMTFTERKHSRCGRADGGCKNGSQAYECMRHKERSRISGRKKIKFGSSLANLSSSDWDRRCTTHLMKVVNESKRKGESRADEEARARTTPCYRLK